MSLTDGVGTDADAGMGPNEVSSAPVTGKPLWKRGRPVSEYLMMLLTQGCLKFVRASHAIVFCKTISIFCCTGS